MSMRIVHRFIMVIFVSLSWLGCDNDDDATPANVEVSTTDIANITPSSATGGGVITVKGNAEIIARGICWSTTADPTIDANATIDGDGAGSFASTLEDLQPNTTYHVRAYASTAQTTTYGNDVTFTTSPPNVYIAGYAYDCCNPIPTYWKNGNAVPLDAINGEAHAMVISGDDIYVAGNGYIPDVGYVAKYWKNGIEVVLTDGTNPAIARSIAVSGSDVYVAGHEYVESFNVAMYWKNGVAVPLTDGSKDAEARSIVISGDDVYVAGFEHNGSVYVAKYWKNGTAVPLSDPTRYAYAHSIVISGTDVYVAGSEDEGDLRAKYWKNGEAVPLTDGSKSAEAFSIFLSGSDVYVAGYDGYEHSVSKYVATYWKNGVAVPLGDGSDNTIARSIVVDGTTVHVAGDKAETLGVDNRATYWKNGVPTYLTDGTGLAQARSIVVSGK
jgi:hypothetical protein